VAGPGVAGPSQTLGIARLASLATGTAAGLKVMGRIVSGFISLRRM
jgi:hypothetical protein